MIDYYAFTISHLTPPLLCSLDKSPKKSFPDGLAQHHTSWKQKIWTRCMPKIFRQNEPYLIYGLNLFRPQVQVFQQYHLYTQCFGGYLLSENIYTQILIEQQIKQFLSYSSKRTLGFNIWICIYFLINGNQLSVVIKSSRDRLLIELLILFNNF